MPSSAAIGLPLCTFDRKDRAAENQHTDVRHDETQCTSRTGLKAARVRVVADNHILRIFRGSRTEPDVRSDNVVPPLLALRFARIAAQVLQPCAASTEPTTTLVGPRFFQIRARSRAGEC
jgi:hypothetical protein